MLYRFCHLREKALYNFVNCKIAGAVVEVGSYET